MTNKLAEVFDVTYPLNLYKDIITDPLEKIKLKNVLFKALRTASDNKALVISMEDGSVITMDVIFDEYSKIRELLRRIRRNIGKEYCDKPDNDVSRHDVIFVYKNKRRDGIVCIPTTQERLSTLFPNYSLYSVVKP